MGEILEYQVSSLISNINYRQKLSDVNVEKIFVGFQLSFLV